MKKRYDIHIGYACQIAGRPDLKYTVCRLINASENRLKAMIGENLSVLEQMIDYNVKNGIRLFRISSDLIPFASHPVNTIDWKADYMAQWARIGQKISRADMRVSMHPGQYCVLNAQNSQVVENAMKDIAYHAAVLDALGTDQRHKIILHVGGVYGNKTEAAERFIQNFERLDASSKSRLVIENDERSYTVKDILNIAERVQIPCVFDILHHTINPPEEQRTAAEWIKRCAATWKDEDGQQKIHYSEQAPDKRPGAHSDTVDHRKFLAFVGGLNGQTPDIMLEVKDKNISAVKCINLLRPDYHVRHLEAEWAKYKYLVLSVSKRHYDDIRELLKNKDSNVTLDFYDRISQALSVPPSTSQAVNAGQHVWGHLKKHASVTEKMSVFLLIKRLNNDIAFEQPLKRKLFKLSVSYNESYLIESYYFSAVK